MSASKITEPAPTSYRLHALKNFLLAPTASVCFLCPFCTQRKNGIKLLEIIHGFICCVEVCIYIFFMFSETSATKELGLREFVYIAVSPRVCHTKEFISVFCGSRFQLSSSCRNRPLHQNMPSSPTHSSSSKRAPCRKNRKWTDVSVSLCVFAWRGHRSLDLCGHKNHVCWSTHNVCWRLVVPSSDL